jgi:FHA domain-containing protein
MGKIVLYLADGTTLDIRLARERITIGRRADNDVCLPYPAVSGEHAAIVTILSDSFLEDLGSTNGTLVNGKPIAKHFLRDRDQIDIGRQKLVYVADESVQLEAGSQLLGRHETRVFGERVEAAKPSPSVVVPELGAIEEAREVKSPASGTSRSDIERFVAAELSAPSPGKSARAAPSVPEPAHAVPAKPDRTVSALRVLTGPNSGRELTLDKDETAVGRVGVAVVAVRRTDGAFRLVPLEGATAPSINGAPVPADGHPLKPGDSFEIAGVRIEMIERPAVDAG